MLKNHKTSTTTDFLNIGFQKFQKFAILGKFYIMNNLFTKYREILNQGDMGLLIRKNLQNNSRKTYKIKGKNKYGTFIHDEFLNKNNELVYNIKYFITYDSAYRYIHFQDLKKSLDYEAEELLK